MSIGMIIAGMIVFYILFILYIISMIVKEPQLSEKEKIKLQIEKAKRLRAQGVCPVCRARLSWVGFRGKEMGGGHMSQCPEEWHYEHGDLCQGGTKLEDELEKLLEDRKDVGY